MDGTVIVTAATAVSVAALSYVFAKRRDRDAEWRKLKLDHYKEFFAAASGMAGERANATAHRRFSDALNAMALVAPPAVHRALYAYHHEVSVSNPTGTRESHDAALNVLFRAIRRDVHPSPPLDDGITFSLVGAPSDDATPRAVR
jgi:hypothetical protein